MATLRKLLYSIGLVSLTLWSALLLVVFLPTTGLLTTTPSESISRQMLDLFRVSGFVASTTCFTIGLEMLGVFPVVQQKFETISTHMLNGRKSTTPVNRKEMHDSVNENPEPLSERVEQEAVEQIGIPSWKKEFKKVRGRHRIVFRDIKTGRYIKNPN